MRSKFQLNRIQPNPHSPLSPPTQPNPTLNSRLEIRLIKSRHANSRLFPANALPPVSNSHQINLPIQLNSSTQSILFRLYRSPSKMPSQPPNPTTFGRAPDSASHRAKAQVGRDTRPRKPSWLLLWPAPHGIACAVDGMGRVIVTG